MRIWRLTASRYVDTAFSGEGTFRVGGRWTPVGYRAVHAASSIALAVLETLVHVAPSVMPAYRVIAVDVPEVMPVATITVADLPDDWRRTPPPSALKGARPGVARCRRNRSDAGALGHRARGSALSRQSPARRFLAAGGSTLRLRSSSTAGSSDPPPDVRPRYTGRRLSDAVLSAPAGYRSSLRSRYAAGGRLQSVPPGHVPASLHVPSVEYTALTQAGDGVCDTCCVCGVWRLPCTCPMEER